MSSDSSKYSLRDVSSGNFFRLSFIDGSPDLTLRLNPRTGVYHTLMGDVSLVVAGSEELDEGHTPARLSDCGTMARYSGLEPRPRDRLSFMLHPVAFSALPYGSNGGTKFTRKSTVILEKSCSTGPFVRTPPIKGIFDNQGNLRTSLRVRSAARGH